MVNNLFKELSELPEVESIALGGSRSGDNYDEKSDYDVYLYCTAPVSEAVRKTILEKYCTRMEIGNHYWEYEDNCTLNNGIDIDILYRNIEDFTNEIASVVEQYCPHNGYTTCMWHNLLTCKVIYDENGRLQKMKDRFNTPYPKQLKRNIIERNMNLLSGTMPSYDYQIAKALKRNDRVSVNHRTAVFMESYFDVIFALNERTHPGEKRLVSLCRQNCKILPNHFEENINTLFDDLMTNPDNVKADIEKIVKELRTVVGEIDGF